MKDEQNRSSDGSKLKRIRRQRNILALPWVLVSLPVSVPLLLIYEFRRKHRNVRRQEKERIRNLSHMLWANQTEFASQELETVAHNMKLSPRNRYNACCALMIWHTFENNFDQAREYGSLIERVAPEFRHSQQRLMLLCQIEYFSGNLKEARRIIEMMPPNLVDSNVEFALASTMIDDSEKLGVINKVLSENGLTPIKMIAPDRPLTLSNIEGTAPPRSIPSQGKVSIIIPVYNAENQISRAIRSICDQTYSDLEIIAVDDCSTDNSVSILHKLAEEDSRIRVFQNTQNSGAYPTRNFGLLQASGDYITVHDADDWSHPEKIEHQVAALSSNADTVASASHWIRATEEMMFSHWQITTNLIIWNRSSLMIKKHVAKTLGPWDPVRFGADAEYSRKIVDVFGADAIVKVLPNAPMSFGLDDDHSLTRNKSSHISTIRHGMRHLYFEISDYWSRQNYFGSAEANAAKLDMLPANFFKGATEQEQISTLYLVDCRCAEDVIKIEAFLEQTYEKIGILHQLNTDASIPYNTHFCDTYFRLLIKNNVLAVASEETVVASKVIEIS